MRKAIIRKIKSERGATLSMALLLFIVCAVVGGVILAAATAASGRVSNLAESDQRYYNVTSAVQLLAEEISGKEVTIERTKTEKVVKDEESSTVSSDDDPEYAYTVNGSSTIPTDFLTQGALSLLCGNGTPDLAGTWSSSLSDKAENGSSEENAYAPGEFQMTLTVGEDTVTAYCNASVKKDGTLIIDVSNLSSESTTGEKYTLELVMKPNISETQNIEVADDAVPISVEAGTANYLVSEKTTKSSTVSWYVGSILEK